MSTPEPRDGSAPDELVLLGGARPGSLDPGVPAPTPGVAPTTRVPGGPTVPEPDPLSLAATLARLANDLFARPPAAPSADAPSHDAPTPAASPLHAPLGLDTLPFFAPPTTSSLPLVDAPPADHDGPYWLRASAPEAPAPAATPWQHDPLTSRGERASLDAPALREEFPILQERVHGRRLVWLDNAATTQKPRAVIDRLSRFYERENSNIHRAAHTLAARATDAYEGARETVRRFLKADSAEEIIFVRGATEGINLIAQSWGRANVREGDEIVVSWLEHHANIVPWQQLCAATGAQLKVAPVDDRGQVILEAYEALLGPRTRLVAFTQVSNALGTITPASAMAALARRHGAAVLIDGAQAVSHMPVDVRALGCDFYVFSGHKVFAPTGIGAVYGRREVLAAMPPWQGGGNMIADVTFERTRYQPPPARFEAGTGNIADAVGLGAALDWLERVGVANVGAWEHSLLEYGTARLQTVPGLRLIGTATEKAGVLSFVLAGQKTESLGARLDRYGIAVRSGHHCAQPILRRFGVEATVRASLAPYNTREDLDLLVEALREIQAGSALA